MPDLSTPRDATDFYFVGASGPDIAITRLIELVKERIPRRFGRTSRAGGAGRSCVNS